MIRCRTLGILTGYIMCTSMCCVSIFIKITFKNNSTNTQVGMGMENYQSQLSTAFVSGNVDFR